MTQYPKKTCDIARLVSQPKLVAAVLDGRKSQQRRDGVYGYPGETFELEGVIFLITDLFQQHLGEMTESEAQAEGYPGLQMYKDIIIKMHPGMSWDEDHQVWVHQFKRFTEQDE